MQKSRDAIKQEKWHRKIHNREYDWLSERFGTSTVHLLSHHNATSRMLSWKFFTLVSDSSQWDFSPPFVFPQTQIIMMLIHHSPAEQSEAPAVCLHIVTRGGKKKLFWKAYENCSFNCSVCVRSAFLCHHGTNSFWLRIKLHTQTLYRRCERSFECI